MIFQGIVIGAKACINFVCELTTIETCDWPTKREVIVWEEIVEIKALPTGGS